MIPQIGCSQDMWHFLNTHSLLSLATTEGSDQHICTVFYSLHKKPFCLAFKSEPKTLHMEHISKNQRVAAAAASVDDLSDIHSIEGVQIHGLVAGFSKKLYPKVENHYRKKFSISQLIPSRIYAVIPLYVKYTNNRRGLGHKETWHNTMEDLEGFNLKWPFYPD